MRNEQPMRALERANSVRQERKRYKARLRRLPVPVAFAVATQEVAHTDPELVTMKAEDFLRAIPRVGKVCSRKLLKDTVIGASKPIGALTPQARERLTRSLNEIARRRYGEEAICPTEVSPSRRNSSSTPRSSATV